jgi:hypothetical protein
MTSIIWERTEWESDAIDMDSNESVGYCWREMGRWRSEVKGAQLTEHFTSLRAAEIAVELALEQEDILHGEGI